MDGVQVKKSDLKLVKKDCKFCKCQSFAKSNCEIKELKIKSIHKDLVVLPKRNKTHLWGNQDKWENWRGSWGW